MGKLHQFLISAALVVVSAMGVIAYDYGSLRAESLSGWQRLSGGRKTIRTLPRQRSESISKRYVGEWLIKFVKTADNCDEFGNPDAFNSSIGVSKKGVGTDYVDNTPLFKGQLSGSSLVFVRAREADGVMHSQNLTLTLRGVGRIRAVLEVETNGPEYNCMTRYVGQGRMISG